MTRLMNGTEVTAMPGEDFPADGGAPSLFGDDGGEAQSIAFWHALLAHEVPFLQQRPIVGTRPGIVANVAAASQIRRARRSPWNRAGRTE